MLWQKKDGTKLIIVVNNIFVYNITYVIIFENDDYEPKSIKECWNWKDLPKWKDGVEVELSSFLKCKVFEPIVQTPKVGYKLLFIRKINEEIEVTRYKVRVVAQGFL